MLESTNRALSFTLFFHSQKNEILPEIINLAFFQTLNGYKKKIEMTHCHDYCILAHVHAHGYFFF